MGNIKAQRYHLTPQPDERTDRYAIRARIPLGQVSDRPGTMRIRGGDTGTRYCLSDNEPATEPLRALPLSSSASLY